MKISQISILLAAGAVIHLLFINKAFHIDDPLFIYAARQIIENPADPYSILINWNGSLRMLADFFSNPPGLAYYLALIILCFGESEVALHISMLPFTVFTIYFGVLIIDRFTKKTLEGSLILSSSPIFLVSMTNLMPDVAMLGFFLGGLHYFFTGFDSKNIWLLLLAGALLAIAIMLRYNAIVSIPIIIAYVAINKKLFKLGYLVTILIPLSVMILWNYYTMKMYGSPHFLGQMKFQEYGFRWWTLIENLGANLVHLCVGSCMISIYLTVQISKPLKKWVVFGLLFIVGLGITGSIYIMKYDVIHGLLVSVFLGSSLIVLLFAIKRLWREKSVQTWRDQFFLLVWIFAILGMHFSGIHTAAKYILPILLPFTVLVLNFLQKSTYPLAVTSLVLGIFLATVDYQHANGYRQTANEIKEVYKIEYGTFTGHWGYQYYMEKIGMENHLKETKDLDSLSYFIKTSLAWPRHVDSKLYQKFRVRDEYLIHSDVPLRLMHNSSGSHANFYSNNVYPGIFGFLPFSFSNHPIDTLTLFQVSK